MKKIWTITCTMLILGTAMAQTGRPQMPLPPPRPAYNANQLPNMQDNSSFNNNSMQNNKPANLNSGPYTGNGNYVDPTKNPPPPAQFNNNMGQLPAPTPLNTNGAGNLNNNGVYNTNSSTDKH